MAKRYPDHEVVSMLLSSDVRLHDEALKYLRKTHESMIMRHVALNSGSREDGEEILNDVVYTFFRNVRSGKFEQQDAQVATYMYAVAKRKWWKELKKRKTRMHAGQDADGVEWDEADEAHITEYENRDLLQKLLAKLEPNCQKLLHAFMEGWSMEEIAVMVGLKNADSAKAQKYHCLKKLGKLSNQLL